MGPFLGGSPMSEEQKKFLLAHLQTAGLLDKMHCCEDHVFALFES